MPLKPVAQKLLITPGRSLWMTPETDSGLIGPLPEGVTTASDLATAYVALIGVTSAATAASALETHAASLAAPPVLWFLYPKGNVTDINRDSLWPMVARYGLRPITQVAVDDTWSALRFRPLRDGEPPFMPKP